MNNQPSDKKINTTEKEEETKGIHTELFSAPQRKLEFSRLTLHLLHLETKDITLKWVFDNIRNHVICGVLLWAGINAFRLPNNAIFDIVTNKIGGAVLIATAFVLFPLNIIHGIIGFSKIRDLRTVSTALYLACAFLMFCAANILFITAKSSLNS